MNSTKALVLGLFAVYWLAVVGILVAARVVYQRTQLNAPAFRHGDDSRVARLDARATAVPVGAGCSPVRQNTGV
jgi:hypothetical protein